jgi:hypothetical protein
MFNRLFALVACETTTPRGDSNNIFDIVAMDVGTEFMEHVFLIHPSLLLCRRT